MPTKGKSYADYAGLIIMGAVVCLMVIAVLAVAVFSWGWSWFVGRPRPLSRHIRRTLPLRQFSGQEEQATCPICLEHYRDGDVVRRLPDCGQVFHQSCVDRWFDTHSTCPICRERVVPYVAGGEVEMAAIGN
ncbi:unnamed protein product [Linum trigynum]|uniref:RING-type domain-containing protein n=1 Tax=Linum trigynum TaxID=586398 RepID=A0AAV2GMJ1_9ROSI